MDVRFEATYWSLLQVLIWVCTRKRNWVRLAADVNRDPYLLVYQATLNGTVLPFETAENEVISKLSSGELGTWALKNGTGDPAEVTSDQWGHLRFHFDPVPHLPHSSRLCAAPHDLLRADSTYWTQLIFRREDVLALWCDPFEETALDQPSDALLPAENVNRQETGFAGRPPKSRDLIEAELDRRVAGGMVWESRQQAAQELRSWLIETHPNAPSPTVKTVINSLRHKIPISPKPALGTSARN